MPIPQEWDLTGKTALITSDKRGWTPFLASALGEAGAAVVVAGSDGSDGPEAAATISKQGGSARFLATDVTDPDAVARALYESVAHYGGVEVLVNNAHTEFAKPFLDVTDDEWQKAMDFNVKSMFLCCQAEPHLWIRDPRIVVTFEENYFLHNCKNHTSTCQYKQIYLPRRRRRKFDVFRPFPP